jgi:GGDEF domain-containing protein
MSGMISIKRYLQKGDQGPAEQEADDTYQRILALLMQGLAMHAVQGEQAAYDRFRADMDGFANTLAGDTDPAALLVAAGGVIKALEEHGRATTAFVRGQHAELNNMVSMLTQTIIKIGANSKASVDKLCDLEKALVQAHMAEDMQLLKMRLGECLATVHDEAERQKTDSQIAIAKLEQEVNASRERISSVALPKEVDRVTGLPSKREAEKALRSVVAEPEGKFVVIVVVGRIHAINARFGYEVGDRILSRCTQQLQSGFSASDELYRWHGPALLAILSRSGRIDQVRTEIRRFADARLEETVEVGNRSVLIPVCLTIPKIIARLASTA